MANTFNIEPEPIKELMFTEVEASKVTRVDDTHYIECWVTGNYKRKNDNFYHEYSHYIKAVSKDEEITIIQPTYLSENKELIELLKQIDIREEPYTPSARMVVVDGIADLRFF